MTLPTTRSSFNNGTARSERARPMSTTRFRAMPMIHELSRPRDRSYRPAR